MQFIHDGLDCGFNLFNFGIQFPDEADCVLQFQGLGRHSGANGASGGIADLHGHIPPIAAFRGICQQGVQSGQMHSGNLLGPWEFRQQRINRHHVKCWRQLLQFREQDAHQPGNGRF